MREELLLDKGMVKPLVDEIKERLKLAAARRFIESLKQQKTQNSRYNLEFQELNLL